MIDAEIATGRWKAILTTLGVNEDFLRNKHGPCPLCGGKDRFRFDDKKGRGTWICNQCGSGDGYSLLQQLNGWKFGDAIKRVNEIAGNYSADPIRKVDNSQKQILVRKIWTESIKITRGDPAWKYLTRRTEIKLIPNVLRFHPALEYTEDGRETSYHPTLICPIQRPDGRGIGVHRIYLDDDGFKADVPSPKKFFVSEEMTGTYVRLNQAKTTLGIAEGVETALAATARFDVPAWSVLMASGMEKFIPPAGVQKLIIFGDNDASFTGQAAAYGLANRLARIRKDLEISVLIPEGVGNDWCSIK